MDYLGSIETVREAVADYPLMKAELAETQTQRS